MPDLNTLLNTANAQSESVPAKKKFSRGIRPDHVACGEVLPVNQMASNTPTPITSEPNVKLVVNDEKTEHKVGTNRAQTEHISIHKVGTNRAQTEHKHRSENSINSVTEHKPDTQPDTPLDTKWTQTAHKLNTKFNFSTLVGLQKELVILVYKSCQKNRSKVSDPITLDFASSTLKIKIGSVKTTFRRLEEKQILSRVEHKNGRGGWAKFELSKTIFTELLQIETEHKLNTNRAQTGYKVDTQPDTQPDTSSPIVVVSSNFKNTTNTETPNPDEPCFVIPNELTGKVSRRQLSEFVLGGKITEYDLQLSLDAFAFDLRNKFVSIKHSSNPVGLLIGAIKNNGSYNSAKYIEALKSELKPLIDTQREFTAEKASIKTSPEWAAFQEFKQNNPDAHKNLEEKMASIGLKGALLEDFTFLEYKKEVLKVGDETELNPLRPLESQSP